VGSVHNSPPGLVSVWEVLGGQIAGGVVDAFAYEVGLPGMLCSVFDHVEDRPSKRHCVAKPGDGCRVEVEFADRLVACVACPREERKNAVGGVAGIELHVVARLKPPRPGGPSEDLAQPVAIGGRHVLHDSEEAHPAGGHGLAELIVGEAIDLPQDHIVLLVKEVGQDLFFAAGSLSGHRESISLVRFSVFEGGGEGRGEGPSEAARRDLGLSITGCPTVIVPRVQPVCYFTVVALVLHFTMRLARSAWLRAIRSKTRSWLWDAVIWGGECMPSTPVLY
jgi:hypothetical protein